MGLGTARNKPCPHGHKSKYKKCCFKIDHDNDHKQYPDALQIKKLNQMFKEEKKKIELAHD